MAKLFIFCFLLSQCSNQNLNVSKKTVVLNNYLETQFQDKIPKQSYCYIIIPGGACFGCIEATVVGIEKKKNEFGSDISVITSFITYSDSVFMERIKQLPNIKFDYSGKLDRLNLDLANPVIIKTKNGEIYSLKSITFENYKRVFNL